VPVDESVVPVVEPVPVVSLPDGLGAVELGAPVAPVEPVPIVLSEPVPVVPVPIVPLGAGAVEGVPVP
jgi:hypothetical protein